MRIICVTLLSLLLLVGNVAAESESGGYTASYLQLGLSARATAMGQAYYAVSDDAVSVFYNPAGAPHILRKEVGFSYRVMDLDRRLGYISAIMPVRNEATISLGWIFAGVNNLAERNSRGEITGDLAYSENVLSLSFARRFSKYVSVGGTGRYYFSKLANVTTNTIGIDIGTYIKLEPDAGLGESSFIDLLRFGFVVGNLGAKYIWTTGDYWGQFGEQGDSRTDDFPLLIGGGVSVLTFDSKLLVAVDARKYKWHDLRFNAGVEYAPQDALRLRAGLDDFNPTFGGGVRRKLDSFELSIDYAFSASKAGERSDHIFSLGLLF